MKVFITGGTGYVGSVLIERLVAAGHEVSALARSDASAAKLEQAGAGPVRGSLADTAVLEASAAAADAVVHAAVDYAMTEESSAVELAAVTAFVAGAGAADAAKPVVYTSTGLVYGFDAARDMSEDAQLPEASAQPVKAAAERIVLGAAGITPVVIRAGLVYGRGGSGLITGLIDAARANGVATYIGDGENAWRPVHVDDLAELYARVLARPAAGVFNAVGDAPFTFRALAEAIAAGADVPAAGIPFEQALAAFGPFAHVLSSTSTMTAEKAERTFGWRPSGASLIDEVRSGSYRAAPAEASV